MKQSVALVLSSGGSKGLAHIGAINALEKQGLEISSIAGSSIGSVIGGFYAMGKLPEFSDWVKGLNRKAVWDYMDFTVSNNGLLKGEKVLDMLRSFLPDTMIEQMNIPFVAVATDILNEKEVLFKTGSFYEAIRASIAIPAVLTPVCYQDTILVDGGVLNPIPIEHVARREKDLLVVVNLYSTTIGESAGKHTSDIGQRSPLYNRSLRSITKLINSGDHRGIGYVSLLKNSMNAMIHQIALLNIEKYNPDILINIPHDYARTFDFHKAEELIKLGELIANDAISNFYGNR